MIVIFGIFLLTLLVITAIAIVRTDNLFVAVMLMGIASLLIAGNFFLLDAADVAARQDRRAQDAAEAPVGLS